MFTSLGLLKGGVVVKKWLIVLTPTLLILVLLQFIIPTASAFTEPSGSIALSYCQANATSSQDENQADNTITCRKGYNYYNDYNKKEWRVSLAATFVLTDGTAECIDVFYTPDIFDKNWRILSESTQISGNTVLVSITFGREFLGIPVGQKTLNMALACDKNGTIY